MINSSNGPIRGSKIRNPARRKPITASFAQRIADNSIVGNKLQFETQAMKKVSSIQGQLRFGAAPPTVGE